MNNTITELIAEEHLDKEQRRFRKYWRRRSMAARFFRVHPTGDVIYTITGPGQPYSAVLAQVLDTYWRDQLVQPVAVGRCQ